MSRLSVFDAILKTFKDYIIAYSMYIRIEFENIENYSTKKTRQLFFSCPNGMFLTSSNSYLISSNEIREAGKDSVVFWYLDIDILHKYYVEGNFIGKHDEMLTILMKYVNGVTP
jgi:hypothetical protein